MGYYQHKIKEPVVIDPHSIKSDIKIEPHCKMNPYTMKAEYV